MKIFISAILILFILAGCANQGFGSAENKKVNTPAQVAKECFMLGGKLHEGEKFRDVDGNFQGFKSVKCVLNNKNEKIFERSNNKQNFVEKK